MTPRKGLFILALLIIVDAIGIGLYTKGFFLTRFEVTKQNTCNSYSNSDVKQLLSPSLSHMNKENICWNSVKFNKIIWIVIDALRFEFAFTNTSTPNEYYHDQFHLIKNLISSPETKNHCLLYKFISESPTVTMQRLKALTTGSIPTFIDINDVKFESANIKEDNLIDQWRMANKSMIMLGDDTWVQLYPEQWTKALDYPSFNAKDIHTVDNGIIDHLIDEINKYDILIAHFLGVDHVGHRYGPNHPAMIAKLNQLDQVLHEVIDKMDEETLFMVMGDHGMTEEGNHGGSTIEETESTLFLYSKGKQLHFRDDDSFLHSFDSVQQIDLVPTIALLTGIPIPFGNLGSIIPDLFYSSTITESDNIDDIKELLRLYQINSAQIISYLQYYTTISSQFPNHLIQEYVIQFKNLANRIEDIITSQNPNVTLLHSISKEYKLILTQILDMCREEWAEFGLLSMICGITCFLVSSIFISVIVLNNSFSNELSILFKSNWKNLFSSRIGVNGLWFTLWMIFCSILHIIGQLSNSCIELDEKVVSFLLTATFGLFLLPSIVNKTNSFNFFQIILLITIPRLSTENILGDRHEGIGSHDTLFQMIIEAIILWVPLFICTIGLHRIASFRYSQKYLRISQVFVVFLVGSFWMLQSYFQLDKILMLQNGIPRVIYSITFIQLCYIIFTPKNSEIIIFHPLLRISTGNIDSQIAGFFLNIIICLWGVIALISGPSGTLALFYLFIQIILFLSIVKNNMNNRFLSLGEALCLSFFTLQYFFATGHHWQLNSLQFESAFIGFETFNWFAGFILMMLNTFSAPILIILSIPLFIGLRQSSCLYSEAFLNYKVFFSWHMLLTLIFVFIERRHLMVWRVFAPKFLIESVLVLSIDIILFGCASMVIYVRNKL